MILSFLGGIHSGTAMTQSISQTDHGIDAGRLGISVVPSAGETRLFAKLTSVAMMKSLPLCCPTDQSIFV